MPLGASIAIAKRSLRIWIDQIILSFQPSIISSVDRAVDSDVNNPGFKSRLRQWNSFKNYKILFLNEDTLAIEVCIKLKSQIDAWKSTFPLSREWKSTFPLSREWKSCNPCMYTMLRQQIYMQWHYQLSAICQMRRMWNDANAEKMLNSCRTRQSLGRDAALYTRNPGGHTTMQGGASS